MKTKYVIPQKEVELIMGNGEQPLQTKKAQKLVKLALSAILHESFECRDSTTTELASRNLTERELKIVENALTRQQSVLSFVGITHGYILKVEREELLKKDLAKKFESALGTMILGKGVPLPVSRKGKKALRKAAVHAYNVHFSRLGGQPRLNSRNMSAEELIELSSLSLTCGHCIDFFEYVAHLVAYVEKLAVTDRAAYKQVVA